MTTTAHPSASGPPLWLGAAILLVCTAIVYSVSIGTGTFLNFDDPFFFDPQSNQTFAKGFDSILDPSQPIANVFLPVAHGSLWLDVQAGAEWGQGEWIVRLHSAVLHWLAGVALIAWLVRLGLARWSAIAGAALFVAHPALVESVAWASSRKDLLAGLFTFASLALLLPKGERLPAWRGVLSMVCALLALYSKATAVVLPVLALLSFLALREDQRRPWRWFAGLAVLTAAVGLHHQSIAAAEGTLQGSSLAETVVRVPGAFFHYLHTAFLPVGLNVLYPEVKNLEAFVNQAVALPVVLVLVGAAVVAVLPQGLRQSWAGRVGLGVLLFFGAILPFNTAFPASSIAAADRYLYLAIPGLALALAALPRVGVYVAAAATVACIPLAFQRADDFRDSESVWSASLATDPDNAVASVNLADHRIRMGTGSLRGLVELYEAAAASARYPEHRARAHLALRKIALAEARFESAVVHAEGVVSAFEELVAKLGIEPAEVIERTERRRRIDVGLLATSDVVVAYGLVEAHMQAFRPCILASNEAARLGMDERATELDRAATRHVEAIGRLAPESAEVLAFRSVLALVEATRTEDEAERERLWQSVAAKLDRVLTAQPNHYEANLVRGNWARLRGETLLAVRHLVAANNANPLDAQGWTDLCEFYVAEEMFESAERTALEGINTYAIRDPKLLYLFATALYSQQKWAQAEQYLEIYVRQRPRDRDARRILAIIVATRGIARLTELDNPALARLIARAEEYAPEEPRLDYLRGHLALKERRFGDAAERFRRYLEVAPADVDARERRVDALIDRGYELMLGRERDEDAAAELWIQALMEAPPTYDRTKAVRTQLKGYARRLVEQATEALRGGDAPGAEGLLRRARRADPSQGDYLLGLALVQIDRLQERGQQRLERWQGEYQASNRASRQRVEEAEALFANASAAAPSPDLRRLADLYRVQALLRLSREAEARALGQVILDDPDTPKDLADRVRKTLQ